MCICFYRGRSVGLSDDNGGIPGAGKVAVSAPPRPSGSFAAASASLNLLYFPTKKKKNQIF